MVNELVSWKTMYLANSRTGLASTTFSGHQALPTFLAISSGLSWMKMALSGLDLLILLDIVLSRALSSSSSPDCRGGSRPARRWWWTATGTFHPREGKTSRASMCTLRWSSPAWTTSRSIALMSVACIGGYRYWATSSFSLAVRPMVVRHRVSLASVICLEHRIMFFQYSSLLG